MEKKIPALVIHPETAAMLATMEDPAAGTMIKALCAYAYQNDPNHLTDPTMRLAFELLRLRIDKDRQAYQNMCQKNQNNARNRWSYDRIPPHTTAYDRIRPNAMDANIIEYNRIEENIIKEKDKKKKLSFVIPEKLNVERFRNTWDAWIKYRKEKKSALTPSTATRQLERLALEDVDVAVAMLEKSIESGWIGLFALGFNANSQPKPTDKSITGLMSIKVK